MKETITKVVIVSALITTLSGCGKNSNTSANRHESSANSSKIASKKYTVATYEGNGKKKTKARRIWLSPKLISFINI